MDSVLLADPVAPSNATWHCTADFMLIAGGVTRRHAGKRASLMRAYPAWWVPAIKPRWPHVQPQEVELDQVPASEKTLRQAAIADHVE